MTAGLHRALALHGAGEPTSGHTMATIGHVPARIDAYSLQIVGAA